MGSNWRYLIAFSIPASIALSLLQGGNWAPFAVVYAFGILPGLELLLPVSKGNPANEEATVRTLNPLFDYFLVLMVPLQFGLMVLLLNTVQKGHHSILEIIGMTFSMGIGCGVLGINVAHELGHRKNRIHQWLARALLCTSLNWQFFIEHNHGHHKNVATPKDSESAHYNESIYAFWIRAIHDSFIGAIRLDPKQMKLGLLIEFSMIWFIASQFGVIPTLCFLGSALFGILLLQSVNYIEHYGLQRKETAPGVYEKVLPEHSWNSSHPLSRAVLFELSRHSDHHAAVNRPYPILRHLDHSPQLPAGYPAMILLALCPPLWYRVMNPRIPKNDANLNQKVA